MATLDPLEINKRIHALEQQREDNHRAINDTERYTVQAHDLASLLSVAVRTSDLNTIDALIISHGAIPILSKARELVHRKVQLHNTLRLNKINRDISDRLQRLDVFELSELKSVKSDILKVDDDILQNDLLLKFSGTINTLKQPLYAQFSESLAASKWMKETSITPDLEQQFINLVNLQSLTQFQYPDSLWAFDLLAKNFKVSFDYHFNSSKDTNSIDKPELFFNYFVNYLSSNLLKIAKLWRLSKTELNERFAHSEFISASIKPINLKLNQYIDILTNAENESINDADSLELLTHLINETIQFDAKLINDFNYDPLNDSSWTGLFNGFTYQQLEKVLIRDIRLYTTQFETIMNQQNVFQIDYTSVNDQDLKPTISSLKLKILIENLTFKNFAKFFAINYDSNNSLLTFKLKVFSKIYLVLLKSYLKRLNEGFDAFNELFKSSKSVITNHPSNDLNISGTHGLERIFRIYCSLKFISNNLNQWNQEFIFTELNELFNVHSPEKSLSLFDFILSDYNKLESKIWNLLESFLSSTITQSLRNYENLNTWNAYTTTQEADEIKVSTELRLLIQSLTSSFSFISKIIPLHDLIKLKQFVVSKIVSFFIDKIIKSNHFNSQGVYQLTHDFQFVLRELKLLNYTKFPTFKKFEEFMKLLRLSHGDISLKVLDGVDIRQFAKSGKFDGLREEYDLQWLNDSEILDALLRIHV